MQLQVDQHAPRAGARDVAVQCQSCFRFKALFERRFPTLLLRALSTRRPPVVRQRRGRRRRDLFHRRRCWARQRRMLIAKTAPAMRTPRATPTRKMGSAGAERTMLSFWAAMCAFGQRVRRRCELKNIGSRTKMNEAGYVFRRRPTRRLAGRKPQNGRAQFRQGRELIVRKRDCATAKRCRTRRERVKRLARSRRGHHRIDSSAGAAK